MNTRKTILTLALASAMGSAPLLMTGTAFAAETEAQTIDKTAVEDAVVKASTDAEEANFIKTVDEAYKAIREIRAARIAIFNGTPEEAAKFADEAQKDLKVAQDSLTEHALMTKQGTEAGNGYVPFDASMSLAEGFVPSDEKSSALEKANEHLSAGKKTEAVAALKLANIDVSVSAALLPAAKSLQHVEDAVKLIKEKKYYEANLALKAVEDSVIIESFDINTIPVQGQKG